MIFDIDTSDSDIGGLMKNRQDRVLRVNVPKPFTRKPIKPRQAHKIATRYSRKGKHDYGVEE